MRLRVTRLAQTDVDEIHDYIARDKPAAAIRWVEQTREQFKFLARSPAAGQARDDVQPGLRSFSHGNYVIFCRPQSDALEIVRVLHGRRDIRALF
jgi:toxin ParE1/3/4